MSRPRQISGNDCVVALFRDITGEDEEIAYAHFSPHLTEQGTPLSALSSCLTDAGWMLTDYMSVAAQACGPQGSVDSEKFKTFWAQFQGIAVMGYTIEGVANRHAILVRSGGIAFDPSQLAPEDGEFIADHFDHKGPITITSVSTVIRMVPANDREEECPER